MEGFSGMNILHSFSNRLEAKKLQMWKMNEVYSFLKILPTYFRRNQGIILTNLIKFRPEIMMHREIVQSSTINDKNEQGIDENNNLNIAETKNK